MNGLIQITFALLPFFARQTNHRAHSPRTTIIGIQFQTLLQRGNGLRRVFLLQVHLRLHGIDAGILTPAHGHRVYLGQRLVIFFLLNTAEYAVVPQVDAFRIIAQGGVIVADGISIVLLLNATQATQLIDTHHVWITMDSFRTVVLCTSIIIQVILRNSSVVPRLKEIRLGRNGLIKILDRKNVILVVEC